MALFDDLDAGDEARRNGDYVSFPHPDSEGDALSGVTIAQGAPVAYDGTDLALVTGDDTDEVTGILANYDVYGDTGQEKVGAEANVKMRGEVKADLSAYNSVTVGAANGPNGEIYVVEELDADNNLYRVQVR